jgi:hypothetical protein
MTSTKTSADLREAAEELRGEANCDIYEAKRRFLLHAGMFEAYDREDLWAALCDLARALEADGVR